MTKPAGSPWLVRRCARCELRIGDGVVPRCRAPALRTSSRPAARHAEVPLVVLELRRSDVRARTRAYELLARSASVRCGGRALAALGPDCAAKQCSAQWPVPATWRVSVWPSRRGVAGAAPRVSADGLERGGSARAGGSRAVLRPEFQRPDVAPGLRRHNRPARVSIVLPVRLRRARRGFLAEESGVSGENGDVADSV